MLKGTSLREELNKRSHLIEQLVSGGSWSLVAGVVALSFGLLSVVLVARALGVEAYGELGMLQSTIGMLAILATFGLNLTLTKHIAQYVALDQEKTRKIYAVTSLFSLFSGTLLCLLTVALSEYLAIQVLDARQLVFPLVLFAPVLVLDAWQSAQLGALAGMQLFKNIALIEMLRAGAQCTVVVAGSYIWGLAGAIGGLLITRVLVVCASTLFVYQAFSERGIVYDFRGCLEQKGVLVSFSLPAALSGIAVAPVMWFCNTLVVRQTGSFAPLGIYNAANQIVTAITVLGESLAKPLLPMLSASAGEGNFLRLINILLPWGIGAMLAVPLLVFPEYVGLVFGEEYSGATFERTLGVVLLIVCLQLYMRGIGREATARGLIWLNFWSNACWAVAVLLFATFLVKYGAVGLALSFLFGYAVNLIVFIPLYRNYQLVPQGALTSFWSLLVWISLIASGLLGARSDSILLQVSLMLVLVCVILLSIWRIVGAHGQSKKA